MMLRNDHAISRDDLRLLASAAGSLAHERRRFRELTPAVLANIARTRGMDFATALFHEAALHVAENAEFFASVERIRPADAARPELIAVVPGAFYREHRGTGADGARVVAIAREIGCAAEIIPVPGFGRLDENARQIAEWLRRRTETSIAIVSLSKGGPDVKRALARPDAADTFARVRLWVSFSGIVQGTPLIGWLRARPLRWWGVHLALWLRRHPASTLRDLETGPRGQLGKWPVLPPHLHLVHICGVPLRDHLQHPWAPRAYDRLASLGPNDGGGVLLGSLTEAPGIVCPIWGADHYLQPSWNATPLLRDIVLAALRRSAPRHATPSAITPMMAPATRSAA